MTERQAEELLGFVVRNDHGIPSFYWPMTGSGRDVSVSDKYEIESMWRLIMSLPAPTGDSDG